MAQKVTEGQTTLRSERAVDRAVLYLTDEKWRVQTQSKRTATFVRKFRIALGRFIIGVVLLIVGIIITVFPLGAIVGVPLLIIGIVLMVMGLRRGGKSQVLVVAATPLKKGAKITITHPRQARKIVNRFMNDLPK